MYIVVAMCHDLFDITRFVTCKCQLSLRQHVVRPDDSQACNYEMETMIHFIKMDRTNNDLYIVCNRFM